MEKIEFGDSQEFELFQRCKITVLSKSNGLTNVSVKNRNKMSLYNRYNYPKQPL